jgi:hypothetical protein
MNGSSVPFEPLPPPFPPAAFVVLCLPATVPFPLAISLSTICAEYSDFNLPPSQHLPGGFDAIVTSTFASPNSPHSIYHASTNQEAITAEAAPSQLQHNRLG